MSRRKKTHGQGSVEWVGRGNKGRYCARISPAPGEPRERLRLTAKDGSPLDDRERDKPLAKKLTAEISRRIRAKTVERLRHERGKRMTVQELGEAWTSGELYAEHGEVNKLRETMKSARSLGSQLKAHVYPVIGSYPVDAVTDLDVRTVMRKAAERSLKRRGKPMRGMTKVNLFNALHRLFELAIEPCRLRTDNPVSKRLKPGKGAPKLFGFLYPTEMMQLIGCADVPIARRVLYALAVYTGLRKGSFYALQWSGIDFSNGTLTSLVSKTGLPLLFEIGHGLPALLDRWHAYQGRPKSGAIVEPSQLGKVLTTWGSDDAGTPIEKLRHAKDREADALRADLSTAGVERAMLFEAGAENVEPIRFHDLRGTFTTWAKREGRGDGWISDRTGHMSTDMIRRYERQARVLADLRYEPFPDVSTALPELVNLTDNVVRLPAR